MIREIACPIVAKMDGGKDTEFFTVHAIPTCRGVARAVMAHFKADGREVFVNWMNVVPLKPNWSVRVE